MSSGKLSFGSFCSMNVEVAGSKVTATADKSGGCSPPSIKMVLDSQFAGNDFKATLKVLDGEFFEVRVEVNIKMTFKNNIYFQKIFVTEFTIFPTSGFKNGPEFSGI